MKASECKTDMQEVFPTSRKQNFRGRKILAFFTYYLKIKEHFNRPTTNIIFSASDLLISFFPFKFLLTSETCRLGIFKISARTEPSTIGRKHSHSIPHEAQTLIWNIILLCLMNQYRSCIRRNNTMLEL